MSAGHFRVETRREAGAVAYSTHQIPEYSGYPCAGYARKFKPPSASRRRAMSVHARLEECHDRRRRLLRDAFLPFRLHHQLFVFLVGQVAQFH